MNNYQASILWVITASVLGSCISFVADPVQHTGQARLLRTRLVQLLEGSLSSNFCLTILQAAHMCGSTALARKAANMALLDFWTAARKDIGGLTQMPFDTLMDFVSSDHLIVGCELDVFWAMEAWVSADSRCRRIHVPALLGKTITHVLLFQRLFGRLVFSMGLVYIEAFAINFLPLLPVRGLRFGPSPLIGLKELELIDQSLMLKVSPLEGLRFVAETFVRIATNSPLHEKICRRPRVCYTCAQS